MRRLLLPLALTLGSSALAGDLHTRDFAATVGSVRLVKVYAFEDRLAGLDDSAQTVKQQGGPACEVRLKVADPFFKAEQVVHASPAACESLKPGEVVAVQYLGIADSAQFVSMKVSGAWYSLPLMRKTAAKHPAMRACLDSKEDSGAVQCAPRRAPAL